MIRYKNILLLFWNLILFLIVMKDTLLCLTKNAIFQTYLGRTLNAVAILFAIAFAYSYRGFHMSKVRKKLAIVVLSYFILIISISIIIHHIPSEVITPYYLIFLLGFILWDMDQWQQERFLTAFQYFLSFYIVLSLILLFFGYGRWEKSFQSYIPSINFRLMGISTQPNGLGFICSIYIGMFFKKSRLITSLAIITLILTQSKTAIIGLAVWYTILCILKIKECKMWIRSLLSVGFLLLNIGIITLLVFNRVPDSGFTGRVGLWRYGFEHWSSSVFNMLFGCGENVLTIYSQFYAKQAHNQFLNNLFGTGIIAFIVILVLSIYVCKWIVLDFQNKKRNSAFLGVVILIRCLMECPFYGLSFENSGMIILAWLTLQINDLNQLKIKRRNKTYENCTFGSGYSK